MTENGLDRFMQRVERRAEERKAQHRADVAYVQKHYPEVAAFLTEMTRAFGRVEYRVTLKGK